MDVANEARPRRSNGAILSRRQSSTPHGPSSQSESTIRPPSAETQDPQPQLNPSYEPSTEARYSKEALLEIYKSTQTSDAANVDVSRLFTETWNPNQSNGANGRGWGKSHDSRDNHGPYISWEPNGSVQPISLEEMTEVERNVSSLNIFSFRLLTATRLSPAMSTLHLSRRPKT
jgi:PERQ amino acid-rich with GYF domain-containing protein